MFSLLFTKLFWCPEIVIYINCGLAVSLVHAYEIFLFFVFRMIAVILMYENNLNIFD